MPRFFSKGGWIEVISGPMFSGKSEELIRRLVRAQIAGQSVIAYKPSIDDRFSKEEIVSRSGSKIECSLISNEELLDAYYLAREKKFILDKDVYAFDEAQFFEEPVDLGMFCEYLAKNGKRVIVCGLDTDYSGWPFQTTSHMLSIADFVDKLTAVCTKCGGQATKTARLTDSKEHILVGDKEYTALCRDCHNKHLEGHNDFI